MSSAARRGLTIKRPDQIPPLRVDPFTPDEHDPMRAAWVQGLWHAQDDRLRQRDRQVEENVRMLLGQHWIVWSELRQRYVDIAEHLSDDERRWRHMPVLNRIFLWYVLTQARMNENPPVITWQPGPDRIDAQLAEVMDPVWKYVWRDVGMLEVIDRLTSWLIPSGRAHLKSRIDPMKGDPIPARGPSVLQLLGGDGTPVLGPDGQPIQREVDDVPLGADMEPLASLREDGGIDGLDTDPHVFYEGGIEVDVLTCLEVRGEWGEHIPWHKKSWHIHRSLVTPLQAFETLGVWLDPDVRGEEAEGVGILWRLLHGSGLYGAADSERTGLQSSTAQEFVTLYECWQAPSRLPGTQRTQESPGGRLTIVTGSGQVVRDGVRIAPFRYTSPIRCFDFTNLPGRPSGSSPQEMLNGPVRTRNRLHAQMISHATLVANPVRVIDRGSGIEEGQVRNIPGEEILADRQDGRPVMEYVHAPPLGREVYDAADRLSAEIDQLGSISGNEGTPPTHDASGELVKELRFNADRPLASPLKRMVLELARMAEDWRVMIPLIWDQEKVLRIVGEDGIARTITVWPHLFEQGTINAEPEIESMLPEGRGERQSRMWRFWQSGVWGDPMSPAAINTFLDLARFPHMGRAVRPGGVDRSTAEQNVGKLLQGVPAQQIPVFEWYDFAIHLHVLEQFMKSPEFLKVEAEVQEQCVLYRQVLLMAQAEAALLQAGRELQVQGRVRGAAAATEADIAAEAGARRPMEPTEGLPRSQQDPEPSTAVA